MRALLVSNALEVEAALRKSGGVGVSALSPFTIGGAR
eukprot:IDg6046t1